MQLKPLCIAPTCVFAHFFANKVYFQASSQMACSEGYIFKLVAFSLLCFLKSVNWNAYTVQFIQTNKNHIKRYHAGDLHSADKLHEKCE